MDRPEQHLVDVVICRNNTLMNMMTNGNERYIGKMARQESNVLPIFESTLPILEHFSREWLCLVLVLDIHSWTWFISLHPM